MIGNARLIQPNNNFEKDLSPFGQKIFNVLIENLNKDKQRCSNSRYNNDFDRRSGQKKKVLTFDATCTPGPALFSHIEQLDDGVKDCSRSTFGDDHDDDDVSRSQFMLNNKPTVGDEPEGFLQITSQNHAAGDAKSVTSATSLRTNASKDHVSVSLLESSRIRINDVKEGSNVVGASLLRYQAQNNFKDGKPTVVSGIVQHNSKQNNFEDTSNIISNSVFQIDSARNIVYNRSDTAKPARLPNYWQPNMAQCYKPSPVNSSSVCSLDFLKPLDFNKNCSDFQFRPKSCDVVVDALQTITPIDTNHLYKTKESDVSWNDMFDTELVPSVPTAATSKENIIRQSITSSETIFNFCFPNDYNSNQKVVSNIEKAGKNITIKKAKTLKRKKENPKEKASKKLKPLNNNLNKTRKEKYTKTVKRWLDGINPKSPVEIEQDKESNTEDLNNIANEESKEEGKTVNKIVNDILDTSTKKGNISVKKIVQARLANKGGIMKFGKPEAKQTDNGALDDTVLGGEPEVNATKRTPRFVAPLKSQLTTNDIEKPGKEIKQRVKQIGQPVKETEQPIARKGQLEEEKEEPVEGIEQPVEQIEFDVVSVGDCNWEEHYAKLRSSDISQVFAVLMYSNGFNQLNKHFTKEECIPEGIMLLADGQFYYFQKTNETFSNNITKFLENRTVVCYDGKSILIFLKQFDLEVIFAVHDVKVGGSLLQPDDAPRSFSALQRLLGAGGEASGGACGEAGGGAGSPLHKATRYLRRLQAAAGALRQRLEERALWTLFEDIEMKVLPIVADMEFTGILVDMSLLASLEARLDARLRQVEQQCHAAAGRAFRPTAPAQVAAQLYDRLQLPAGGSLAGETRARGDRSTSEAMLRSLSALHPLPALVLEHRRLQQVRGTVLAGLRRHQRRGLLRPVWEQNAAATGRIASCSPNVQAIPKADFDVGDGGEPVCLRALLAARAGRVLLAADYRHVECRVFARAAADRALRDALDAHDDLFTTLAATWLKKPAAAVSAAQRERTKRAVYARMYGAGARTLRDIGAAEGFDRTFPSLRGFAGRVRLALRASRCPRSACGRARPLPALGASRAAHRARALRQAVNFLVQGTVADVCKIAMWSAQAQLAAAGVRARLLLQIHDELVWELRRGDLPRAAEIIRRAMERSGACAGLPALPVALRAGRSWGQLSALL